MRFVVKALAIILVTVWDSLIVIFSILLKVKTYNFYKHYKSWASKILHICSIKLKVEGLELLDKNKTYIFASNHSSLFDIPVIFTAVDRPAKIIYKKELEKVPIFGWMLKKSPFISVIRDDPRKAMDSVEQALLSIRQDISVIIYPEGTRSKDGKLGDFKRGGFLLASRSGKPVVPTIIKGTTNILPKGKLRFNPGNIEVIFKEPLSSLSENQNRNDKEMLLKVRQAILEELELNHHSNYSSIV